MNEEESEGRGIYKRWDINLYFIKFNVSYYKEEDEEIPEDKIIHKEISTTFLNKIRFKLEYNEGEIWSNYGFKISKLWKNGSVNEETIIYEKEFLGKDLR